jgi:hypothetical protein
MEAVQPLRTRRRIIRGVAAALFAALLVAGCSVEVTPDGVQVCYETSAGIACTLTPFEP